MKTNRRTAKKDAVQTIDKSAGGPAGVTALRSTGGKKGKRTSSSSPAGASTRGGRPTYEQVAERARAIWQERGCIPGQDERNWLEAEAELRRELGFESPPS